MIARGFQPFVPNLACSYDDTECRYRHEACQNWRAPHVSRWGSLLHWRLVLCGCGYAPLCENLQASAALQSSPYLTSHHWAACASVPACTSCCQISDRTFLCASRLGANLFEFHGGCDWLAVIRMPAFGRSDISSRRSISAQLFAVLVTMSPADSCSNGVRFDTSMSEWKNNSFFIRIENRYSMNSGI